MRDQLSTSYNVANRLRLDVETVRRLARQGRIESVTIGGRYRFTEEAIQKFIESGGDVDKGAGDDKH